jgi:hypothetical protein
VATHASDTTVLGLITNNDKTAYSRGGEDPESVVPGK